MVDATPVPVRRTPLNGRGLVVPQITDETSTLTAALAYADAGFYVLPINPTTRIPLLKEWQRRSSRDRDQLCEWFIGTDHALAVHAGRSGVVVFDVDRPERMPEALGAAIAEFEPPFHATRDEHNGRGHYLFEVPPGRLLGNGRGKLFDRGTDPKDRSRGWGEVRGHNGFIIVAPSEHAKGGHYHWERAGLVPALPDSIGQLLPEGSETGEIADDDAVARFMTKHTVAYSPKRLEWILAAFEKEATTGSRHEAMVHALCWAMREAQDGHFPAAQARDALQAVFVRLMAADPATAGRPVLSEYHGGVAFAVGQALVTPSVASKALAPSAPALQPQPGSPFVTAAPVAGIPAPRAATPQESAPVEQLQADGAFGGAGAEPVAEDGAFGEVGDPLRPTKDYFTDREVGLNVSMLTGDILSLGPLAYGRDHNFWAYRSGVWRRCPEAIVGRCTRLLAERYRPSYPAAAKDMVRHHRDVPTLNFTPVKDVMNFANGLLDWRTGQLAPHSPEVRTTIQFPVNWDPEATCPKFDGFLEQIMEEETRDLLWEVIGYLLYAGNPLQVAVLFYGEGGNGKGTVLRVLQSLLGTENISSVSLDALNRDRFAPAEMFGKIANIAGDIDATFQETTASFKMLTGEDVFRGQQKYGQPFSFENWAVPVFSANKIPGSSDTSEGYLRRWVLVPFNTHVPKHKQIQGLSAQLLDELPGIAAKALPALRRLLERGHFDLGQGAVAQARQDFVEDIDRVRQWLTECTTTSEAAREPVSVAYKSFQVWCEANGMHGMSSKEFYKRVESAGLRRVKIQGTFHFSGLHVMVHRYVAGPTPIPAAVEAGLLTPEELL